MKRRIAIAIAIALGASGAAHAVYLNPRGMGQVLIYPYYTVNAGQSTLLTLVNTTAQGKAVKLRFHEGYNGRDVLDFNVYLSPFDVWAAAVAQRDSTADAPASILTNDNSCTVPAFNPPPQGELARFLDFSTASYTGANTDTGPITGARTREGHFDIIEMGEVTNAAQGTLDAITHVDGVPQSCAQLTTAWAAGGYWQTDATIDLSQPTGGLYGAESIIDVAQGTIYTINAEAIDGFSATIQHTAPGSAAPDLNTANDGPASAFTTVTAQVPVSGQIVKAPYQNPVDAVSALFMADSLYNEYQIDPVVGAQSDWVVTFPTKRFYVDPAIIGGSASGPYPPFGVLFGADVSNPGTACVFAEDNVWDREEAVNFVFENDPPPRPPMSATCFETSILPVGTPTSTLGSTLIVVPSSSNSGSASEIPISPFSFTSGHIALEFVPFGLPDQGPTLTASTNGDVFAGLPAIGFLAVNYVNANVTPGVLANYSGLFPHRASVICTNSTNPQNACQ